MRKHETISGNDLLPIERAARIVAPISDHIGQGYFEGAIFNVLRMLGEFDIGVEAEVALATPPFDVPFPTLTKGWFAAIQQFHTEADIVNLADWQRDFVVWAKTKLVVSRADLVRNLRAPSEPGHEPVGHVDVPGAIWSFPQVLAWVATRDAKEVARIRFLDHFGIPFSREKAGQLETAQSDMGRITVGRSEPKPFLQSEWGRRKLIGWLVLQTSQHHCKCGAKTTPDREAWEACICVGRAYEQLLAFAKGTAHPLPEYQQQAQHASFTLTWPDGAHNLRWPRYEVFKQWPPMARKRQLDHDKIQARASELRIGQPDLSIGAAAASIALELDPNPKTGRPRDARGIERIISTLWR